MRDRRDLGDNVVKSYTVIDPYIVLGFGSLKS